MKRIALILVAALGCAVVLFALLVALVPREALKSQMSEQIASWTGRDVSLRGEPEIHIFPSLSVTLNDVHVAGPEGMEDAEVISMDRLTGTVRLLPLMIGRIEIASYTMMRPLVRLVRDGKGRRNWDFDSGAAALQLAFAGDVPLGQFTLEGGTITYEDRLGGDGERLDSVNLSISWPSVRNPLAISGSGIWRGELVTASGKAAEPFAFLNGHATPVDLRLDSAPMNVVLTGEANEYPASKVTGSLQLSTPSLRRFASWLGSAIGPGSTLGQASGSGTALIDRDGLSVENAEVSLDGNTATGALKIAISPKLDITGTLAFDALDLSPYFDGFSTAVATSADWRRVALPTDWFGGMNADIRLSANAVQIGTLAASSAAASAILHEGRLEIGLARALFGGGSIAGTLAITGAQNGQPATAEAQLRGSDIAFAVPAATLKLPLSASGTTSLFVDLSTKGPDLGAMLGGLSGAARLTVTNANVPLFGIGEVARAAAGNAKPAQAPGQALELVPVTSASAGLRFSSSVLTLDRGEVVTPSYAASVQGWIGLLDGSLGLNGTVTPGGTAASSTPSLAPTPLQVTSAQGTSEPTATGTSTEPVAASPAAGAPASSLPGIPFIIEGTLAAPVVRTQ